MSRGRELNHRRYEISKQQDFLLARYGDRCANCGAEDVQWHHIVPINAGGTDAITNFAPLCKCCHYQLHTGCLIDYEKLKSMCTGRPKKELTEHERAIVVDYIMCKIPNKYAAAQLGWKRMLNYHRVVVEEAERIGVSSFKNNMEVRLALNGGVLEGEPVGWIVASDTHKKKTIYADRKYSPAEFGITVSSRAKQQESEVVSG